MKKIFTILFCCVFYSQYAQDWETVVSLPGRSPVKQIEIVNDNNIYVSSQYYKLYNWNGSEWNSVGDFNPGFNGKFYYKSDNEIYATHNTYLNGKDETEYNYIAKWDGISWSNFGNFNQPKSIHNFKIVSEDEAYAVGEFDDLDGFRWRSVAKFNGSTWNVIGLDDPLAGTYAGNNSLWVNNENDLYSKWDSYRSSGEKKVKHWDGTSWSLLRNFELDEIYDLDRIHVVSENEIYINTWNKNIDYGVIGLWDGNYWRILGDIQTDLNTGGFYGSLDFIFVSSNEIYAFGSALRVRNQFNYQVAVWNGTKWSNLGNLDANNPVRTGFYKNGFLYVGGDFTESGKTLIKKIDAQKVLSTSKYNSQNNNKIYPNPVKDICYLNKSFPKIIVYDISGKKIKTFYNQSEIHLADIDNGFYLLQLFNNEQEISLLKIVKE